MPLGEHGDVYDRYMIRILEMRESLKILEQAMRDIPGGPIMDPKTKIRGFRPKPGEAYGRIESPKGELGFYLISDGSPNPYRYRVRPPSLINLTVLEDMCLGPERGRRRGHSRQRGHRAGRGGSLIVRPNGKRRSEGQQCLVKAS